MNAATLYGLCGAALVMIPLVFLLAKNRPGGGGGGAAAMH